MQLTSKYFKQAFLLLCLASVGLIPVLMEPDIGLAQPGSPLSESNSIVTAYADAMKIDYAEAERRLTLQHEMSLVEQKIATDDAYFASWMQHEPTFGLVVSFSAPDGEERIRKYLEGVEWADLVTVQESDITRDELANMRSTVVQEAEKTGIDFGSGLDYRTGQVRIYADADSIEKLRIELEANKAVAPIMDRIEFIEEAGAAPADYDYPYLLGGHALTSDTSGFPVYRTATGVRYIIRRATVIIRKMCAMATQMLSAWGMSFGKQLERCQPVW